MGTNIPGIDKLDQRIEELLRSHNLVATSPRKHVLKALIQSEKPCDALSLYKTLSAQKLSLSTIYRALSTFVDVSLATMNISYDGIRTYQYAQGHKHLLRCSSCKQTISLDSCPLESYSKDLESKTGFAITGHNLEFIGLCPECKASEEQAEQDL